MKHRFRFSIFLAALVCLLALLLCTGALAASDAPVRYVAASGAGADGTVGLQAVSGTNYLFLPASADLRALRLEFSTDSATLIGNLQSVSVRSGEAFDLTALFSNAPADGRWQLRAVIGGRTVRFTLMRSSGTASLFLTSPDADHGRSWVELDKNNKAKGGGCLLLRADGSAIYDGKLKQLKGRGNATWNHPKRPYQIKLSKAADLMETGLDGEANGTWVLLADFEDSSHLHNRLTFALAEGLGLDYSPHSRTVDLWYDGEYRGQYLLSEKTEIGEGRIEIRDLEAEIEELNEGSDALDKPVTALGTNAFGNQFQYVVGLELPEDYRDGYLLELDYENRALSEASWFRTTAGMYVVVKSPEYLSEDGVRYVSERYQRFEDAVMSGDEAALAELADLDSLARVYLLLEYAFDRDAYFSSTFFYLPADGVLRSGPVWDFDNSYVAGTEGYYAACTQLGNALVQLDVFRIAVQRAVPEFSRLMELVLGGDADTAQGSLRSLAGWERELGDGWRMDQVLWPYVIGSTWEEHVNKTTWRDAMETFEDFLRKRLDWLVPAVRGWRVGAADAAFYLDVSTDAPYYDDVTYVIERGIFLGVSASRFSPDTTLNRAMAVALLYRLAGSPDLGARTPFYDVDPARWYAEAVAWAAKTGLVRGYKDGSFRPDSPVTREEFLTLLHRSVGAPQVTDAASLAAARTAGASSWAAEAAAWARSRGIWAAGTALRADADTLRHEAASFLAAYDRSYGVG